MHLEIKINKRKRTKTLHPAAARGAGVCWCGRVVRRQYHRITPTPPEGRQSCRRPDQMTRSRRLQRRLLQRGRSACCSDIVCVGKVDGRALRCCSVPRTLNRVMAFSKIRPRVRLKFRKISAKIADSVENFWSDPPFFALILTYAHFNYGI